MVLGGNSHVGFLRGRQRRGLISVSSLLLLLLYAWRNLSFSPSFSTWQDLKDFARTAGNVHYAEVSRGDPSEG